MQEEEGADTMPRRQYPSPLWPGLLYISIVMSMIGLLLVLTLSGKSDNETSMVKISPIVLRELAMQCKATRVMIERAENHTFTFILHRGASKSAPENTLESMLQSKALSIPFVELDIRWSQDNVPYLMHDATLDRTTLSDGRLDSYHSSFLDTVILDYGPFLGNPFVQAASKPIYIPRLSVALELAREENIGLNLDCKNETSANLAALAGLILSSGVDLERLRININANLLDDFVVAYPTLSIWSDQLSFTGNQLTHIDTLAREAALVDAEFAATSDKRLLIYVRDTNISSLQVALAWRPHFIQFEEAYHFLQCAT